MPKASNTTQAIRSSENSTISLCSVDSTLSQKQQWAQEWAMVLGLCVFAILGRLLIDIPNFKPTMAVALISGFLFKDWRFAIAAPLFSMLLTDLWLGSYELPLMAAVYACMLAPVLWSQIMDRRLGTGRFAKIVSWNVGGVAAAVLFFVVTNFVCWFATPWYPQTVAGLANCYINALPFLRWMILGNLLFINVIAGAMFVFSFANAGTFVKAATFAKAATKERNAVVVAN